MVHQLLPGTSAQVLAPGQPDAHSFESAFVGGWLCELPGLPGLAGGTCEVWSKGWGYDTIGHAQILTNPDYTRIGCAQAAGVWACDLGLPVPE